MVKGEQIIRESDPRIAHMQIPGGRGRKPDTHHFMFRKRTKKSPFASFSSEKEAPPRSGKAQSSFFLKKKTQKNFYFWGDTSFFNVPWV
jgi:hypothetical protein